MTFFTLGEAIFPIPGWISQSAVWGMPNAQESILGPLMCKANAGTTGSQRQGMIILMIHHLNLELVINFILPGISDVIVVTAD